MCVPKGDPGCSDRPYFFKKMTKERCANEKTGVARILYSVMRCHDPSLHDGDMRTIKDMFPGFKATPCKSITANFGNFEEQKDAIASKMRAMRECNFTSKENTVIGFAIESLI